MLKSLRLTTPELLIFLMVLVLHLSGIYLAHTDKYFFENQYVVEDGPIEWLTVAGLVFGIYVCIRRAWLKKEKNGLYLISTLGLAFILFFIAGEEISWGQRIFDIQSTEYFKAHNTQGELNIHNLKFGEVKLNRVIFSLMLFTVVALYLLLTPIIYKYHFRIRQFINYSGIPVPRLFHIIGFAGFFLLTELVPFGKRAELMEFAGAFMFLLIIWFPKNLEAFPEKKGI